MRELSLFSGAGGGLLGSTLLGFQTVGYVENNPYCQKVLYRRMNDGYLHRAPIYTDIVDFISNGSADQFKDKVDVVSGGFPCQRFSTAARGRNVHKNLWPETREVMARVRPQFGFFENVNQLRNWEQEFWQILKDLSDLGYDVEWDSISAGSIGAPHKRSRLWLLASDSNRKSQSDCAHHAGKAQGVRHVEWGPMPRDIRVGNGLAHRMDRFRAVGNGEVPGVVRYAWYSLLERSMNALS